MYVGSDGRVTAKRSLATYFTWPEIKRLFWELINVIVLLFVHPLFFPFFPHLLIFTSSPNEHSFKSIFKPESVAEAEDRRHHACGGPGFTTSGSGGGNGGNGGNGGPARRPMGRINHASSLSCPTSG